MFIYIYIYVGTNIHEYLLKYEWQIKLKTNTF